MDFTREYNRLNSICGENVLLFDYYSHDVHLRWYYTNTLNQNYLILVYEINDVSSYINFLFKKNGDKVEYKNYYLGENAKYLRNFYSEKDNNFLLLFTEFSQHILNDEPILSTNQYVKRITTNIRRNNPKILINNGECFFFYLRKLKYIHGHREIISDDKLKDSYDIIGKDETWYIIRRGFRPVFTTDPTKQRKFALTEDMFN